MGWGCMTSCMMMMMLFPVCVFGAFEASCLLLWHRKHWMQPVGRYSCRTGGCADEAQCSVHDFFSIVYFRGSFGTGGDVSGSAVRLP